MAYYKRSIIYIVLQHVNQCKLEPPPIDKEIEKKLRNRTYNKTRGQEARQKVNEMKMLRWMCGVTRRDTIRNEHIGGTTRVVQASKKITEKRLKWYDHVMTMKEEHIVRRMLDVEIPGKRRRGRPNLRWKYACKRDMTEVGLKEDNTTNRAAWRKKLHSYTGDPRQRDKLGMKKNISNNRRTLRSTTTESCSSDDVTEST